MALSRSALAVSAVLAAVAAGCGGNATAQAPTATAPAPVNVEVSEYHYSMPSVIKGGVVAMHFRNTGTEPHEFGIGRLDKGHTPAEFRKAFAAGKEVTWAHDIGGPPLLTPGADITITRTFQPGTYVLLCGVPNTKGIPHIKLGEFRSFTVSGNTGATLPNPDAVITAGNKTFHVPTLTAGKQTIELRNTSTKGRGFILMTLNPGNTQADFDKWSQSIGSTGRLPTTPLPATFLGAMQTIPSGASVFITVKLEAGREYQISDDESGIHAGFTPK
jgi:hypothetical protein